MYGVVGNSIRTLKHGVYGENGYFYEKIMASKLVLDVGDVVTFTELKLEDGSRTAEPLSIIKSNPAPKELLKKIYENWCQEATEDCRNQDLYLPTKATNELTRNKNIMFILGRKGTGKSAIANYFKASKDNIADVFDFYQSFDLKLVNEIGCHQLVWEIQYLTLALTIFGRSQKCSKLQKIKIANSNLIYPEKKFFRRIFNFIKERTPGPIVKLLVKLSVLFWAPPMISLPVILTDINPSDILNIIQNDVIPNKNRNNSVNYVVRQLQAHAQALKNLYQSLGEVPEITVIFDRIDDDYKVEGDLGKDFGINIDKLLSASVEIRKLAYDEVIPIKIRPLVLLREDIYHSFDSANKGKYFDKTLTLNWTTDDLKSIITHRLGVSLELPGLAFEDLWLSIFEPVFEERKIDNNENIKDITYISSYESFLRHTSRTPRDCIEILKTVAGKLSQSQQDYCDTELFKQVRVIASKYYIQQIKDAGKPYIENIESILKRLMEANTAVNLNKETIKKYLDNICPDVDKALEILYSLAAIAVSNNSEQYKRYRAIYTGEMEFFLRDKHESIVFHPLVSEAMQQNSRVNAVFFSNVQDTQDGEDAEDGEDVSSLSEGEGKFLLIDCLCNSMLINEDNRQAIKKRLATEKYEMIVSSSELNNQDNTYFLCQSAKFLQTIYLNPLLFKKGDLIKRGDKLTVSLEIVTPTSRPRSFAVKSIEGYDYIRSREIIKPKYRLEDLEDIKKHSAISASLSKNLWMIKIIKVLPSGVAFAEHKEFESNIICFLNGRDKELNNIKVGDIREASIEIGLDSMDRVYKYRGYLK